MGELAARIHAVGRMVRGDELNRAIAHGVPKRLLIIAATLRGRAHEAGWVLTLQNVFGHEQVMRAGLGLHLDATGMGRADDLGPFAGRDVKDHDPRPGEFGKAAHPVNGLDLGRAGVGGRMVFWRDLALGQ